MAEIINRINVGGSLMTMNVGETLVFPFKGVTPNTVHSNVNAIRKKYGRDFKVNTSFLESKTKVTRVK